MSSTPPTADSAATTWPAGRQPAPAFALHDEHGAPVSLAALRGRPVLVTFIDPLCRDFCPLEAQRLSAAVRAHPQAAIVAVSVNTAGNTPATLALDRRKWNVPPQWHWAIGTQSQLAHVWRQFHIEVIVGNKTIAGVHMRQVAHTEASYLIDPKGDERALFLWPYSTAAVTKELAALAASAS
jgi:cytochrome oxidase Cu insertion factor (SCO1/SenC/PrrC family)